jgi:hypothetical protein
MLKTRKTILKWIEARESENGKNSNTPLFAGFLSKKHGEKAAHVEVKVERKITRKKIFDN